MSTSSPYLARRYWLSAAAAVLFQIPVAIAWTIICGIVFAPIYRNGAIADLSEIIADRNLVEISQQLHAWEITFAITLAVSAFVAGSHAWRSTPRTEPFTQLDEGEPKIYYDIAARDELKRRFFREAGRNAKTGIYLAPYLAMPRAAELKNILVVGAPNSGKSNIIRAIADQAIERDDLVMLLCNKGDVTRSFLPDEAILIGAHHAQSHAWDMAADIYGPAGAMQLAADIIPQSNPPFWSDSARLVLTDIITNIIYTKHRSWSARDIVEAALADTEVIAHAIAQIDLGAGVLLEGGAEDGEDRTVAGILLTMRSAVLANLRPLAWAWEGMPSSRRFSIRDWISGEQDGPRTVILQFSPQFEAVSTMVIGGMLKRLARQLADPETPIDPNRRVFIILDEFHVLDRPIDGLETALAVGREKGLAVVVGLQSTAQLVARYGERKANMLLDLFQIRIYGRLLAGDATDRIVRGLGSRVVRALVANATPAADDKRKKIERTSTGAVFDAARFSGELGVVNNANDTGDVRALIHAYGQVFLLAWPFTIWRGRRKGYVPAKWVLKLRRRPQRIR